MGFKNSNLSYRAYPTEVLKGRALKLSSDGTVKHITAFNDPVIGWSMEDVPANGMVSVASMTEGTIYAEVESGASVYAGEILGMTNNGQVTNLETSDILGVDLVDTSTPNQVILGFPNQAFTHSWVNYSCSIIAPNPGHPRLGTYYTILLNTNNFVKIDTTNVPDPLTGWTLPMSIRFIKPMVGYSLEYVQSSGTDKKYAEVLMLRQLARFDRQPY